MYIRWFLLFPLLGCSADLCPKVYEKMKECAPEDAKSKMPSKPEFLETCEAEQKKEKDAGTYDEAEEKAVRECLDKDCDELQECMSKQSEKRYTHKKLAEIEAASKSGDVEKMKEACQYIDEENKELATACKNVMPQLLAAATDGVTKQRDAGEHDFGACYDLEAYAKNVGGDAEANAKTLCEEAKASQAVKEAKDAVQANIAKKEADMPYQCKSAIEQLDAVGTDWAKNKRGEVITACYQDLGKVIMEVKVPQMKYICDFRVKEIYQAAKTHKLEDAELRGWIEKAKPLCEKA
jgi:hypothetical protein